MIACVDTYYTDTFSRTAIVLFECWSDETALSENVISQQQRAAEYIPGQFFARELPCILDAIELYHDDIETIVIDGYVQLGIGRAGLGQKLYEALDENTAIIGVAKNEFRGVDNARQIFRGGSRRPLFITAAAMNLEEAAQSIKNMHGNHRIPVLLKRADTLSRQGPSTNH